VGLLFRLIVVANFALDASPRHCLPDLPKPHSRLTQKPAARCTGHALQVHIRAFIALLVAAKVEKLIRRSSDPAG
jgi:hypothetical protein